MPLPYAPKEMKNDDKSIIPTSEANTSSISSVTVLNRLSFVHFAGDIGPATYRNAS